MKGTRLSIGALATYTDLIRSPFVDYRRRVSANLLEQLWKETA